MKREPINQPYSAPQTELVSFRPDRNCLASTKPLDDFGNNEMHDEDF